MPASSPGTRLIFQNFSVYVSPAATSGSTATGAMFYYTGPGFTGLANSGNNLTAQLANLTNASLSVGINRQDLNVLGLLQRKNQLILSPPSIQLSFGYNVTDAYNERMLGFSTKGAAFLSGILTKESDSKNYFVAVSQQGVDEIGVSTPSARDVYGIGNGFISNYTISAAVGQVATASVTVDGLNVAGFHGSSGNMSPAVDPLTSARSTIWRWQLPVGVPFTGGNTIDAIRPGDITATFPASAGFLVSLSGSNQVPLQSFDLSMPISRQVINKLGSPLGVSREIQFPLSCQLSLRALQNEVATGSFDQIFCSDPNYNGTITLKKPGCAGSSTADAIVLKINSFKVDNVSLGMTVGGDATVDISASAQLAGALSTDGISMSGFYGNDPAG